MVFQKNRLLTILLVIGVLGAAWSLSYRYSAEHHNRAVEIAVDYNDVSELAGASGVSVSQALDKLKSAGVTSIAIQERTVGDLVAQGQVRVVRVEPGVGTTVMKELTTRVLDPLVESGRGRRGLVSATVAIAGSPDEVGVRGTPEYVLSLPVGLPAVAVSDARKAGMSVVARLVNYPGVKATDVDKSASQLAKDGVHTVIFSADQVLGFRGAIDDVANAFKAHNIAFGSVEFAKQKGDEKLSEKMLPDVIRVHSITGAEMGTIERGSAIERFVKAARERNVRLMYVRMFDLSDPNVLDTNVGYVDDISKSLKKKGFTLEAAHPFKDPGVPAAARVLMGLGVAAGAMLLLLSVVKLKPSAVWAVYAILAVGFCGVAALGIVIGLKMLTLLAGIVFPSLAVLNSASGTPEQQSNKPLKAYIAPAAVRFIGALLITGAGGLMIAGLLSRLPFMLRVDQYAGVKLAHIAPIMLIAFLFVAGIGWGADDWRKQKAKVAESFRNIGTQPVLFWQTALGLVLLVVIGLVLARSGNDSGVEVSGLELRFRSILDVLLFVRPRTKEFLFGHPAFFVGLTAALGGRRNWAALLMVLGTIGEVSVLNTFCHIHTPIEMSIIRVAIGAVLGLILGIGLLLMFSRGRKASVISGKEPVGVAKASK